MTLCACSDPCAAQVNIVSMLVSLSAHPETVEEVLLPHCSKTSYILTHCTMSCCNRLHYVVLQDFLFWVLDFLCALGFLIRPLLYVTLVTLH